MHKKHFASDRAMPGPTGGAYSTLPDPLAAFLCRVGCKTTAQSVILRSHFAAVKDWVRRAGKVQRGGEGSSPHHQFLDMPLLPNLVISIWTDSG